jgi:hypothetical protein
LFFVFLRFFLLFPDSPRYSMLFRFSILQLINSESETEASKRMEENLRLLILTKQRPCQARIPPGATNSPFR